MCSVTVVRIPIVLFTSTPDVTLAHPQSVIRKLGSGILPLADRIMTLVLRLIQSAGKTSTILEDAFLVVGSLSAAIEVKFAPYIQAFLPFLYPALKAYEDTQLCTVAVGIIGDITRALGDQTEQYAQAFVTVLLENLSSEVLNRNVKISILACFGDVALAIGPKFEPYLETAMTVLRQAAALQANPVRVFEGLPSPPSVEFTEPFRWFAARLRVHRLHRQLARGHS